MEKIRVVKKGLWWFWQLLFLITLIIFLVFLYYVAPMRSGGGEFIFDFFGVKGRLFLEMIKVGVSGKLNVEIPGIYRAFFIDKQEIFVFCLGLSLFALGLYYGILVSNKWAKGKALDISQLSITKGFRKKVSGKIPISRPMLIGKKVYFFIIHTTYFLHLFKVGSEQVLICCDFDKVDEFISNNTPLGQFYAKLVGDHEVEIYHNPSEKKLFELSSEQIKAVNVNGEKEE